MMLELVVSLELSSVFLNSLCGILGVEQICGPTDVSREATVCYSVVLEEMTRLKA